MYDPPASETRNAVSSATSSAVPTRPSGITEPATALRVLRFARAAKRHNLEDRLHEIQAPTLIVWGLDDRIAPPEVAARFDALIPESWIGRPPAALRPTVRSHRDSLLPFSHWRRPK